MITIQTQPSRYPIDNVLQELHAARLVCWAASDMTSNAGPGYIDLDALARVVDALEQRRQIAGAPRDE